VFEMLDHYISMHSIDLDKDYLKIIRDAGHESLVRAVVRILFMRKPEDNKRFAIWLNGPTSAGKSKFIRRLQEILVCQKADF